MGKVKDEWQEEVYRLSIEAQSSEYIKELEEELERSREENYELRYKIEHLEGVVADLYITYGVCE